MRHIFQVVWAHLMVWVPMSTGSLPGVWSTSVTLAISTTVVQALRFTPALEDELQKMEANVSSSIKQLILQSCNPCLFAKSGPGDHSFSVPGLWNSVRVLILIFFQTNSKHKENWQSPRLENYVFCWSWHHQYWPEHSKSKVKKEINLTKPYKQSTTQAVATSVWPLCGSWRSFCP